MVALQQAVIDAGFSTRLVAISKIVYLEPAQYLLELLRCLLH